MAGVERERNGEKSFTSAKYKRKEEGTPDTMQLFLLFLAFARRM